LDGEKEPDRRENGVDAPAVVHTGGSERGDFGVWVRGSGSVVLPVRRPDYRA
jgi:hypothetical protein